MNIIASGVFFALTFILWAVLDKMQFHPHSWLFSLLPKPKKKEFYWAPQVSWVYKYKSYRIVGGKGIVHEFTPAFPGSITWLVWLTDGWHLVKILVVISLCLAFVFLIGVWWYFPVMLVLSGGIFELTFRIL